MKNEITKEDLSRGLPPPREPLTEEWRLWSITRGEVSARLQKIQDLLMDEEWDYAADEVADWMEDLRKSRVTYFQS